MNGTSVSANLPTAVVVNNDPRQVTMLTGLLIKEGLTPRIFNGAEVALADMTANAGNLPALIVTDLYMPGIDGWRFCRLLRSPEYSVLNNVPILVVSSTFVGTEPDRIAADLGVETFLSSPVDSKLFSEQVQAILNKKHLQKPLKVLIVEDSKALAGMLKKTFIAHGYEADTASTINEAAVVFDKNVYDVAVLDYHLPDGSGDYLLDKFRANRPDCVCLMMTTDPNPGLAMNWMKRGAAAYLRKPFKPEYLIELCANARRERSLLRVQDMLEMRTRELRESEAKYRLLADHMTDQVWLMDMNLKATYISPSAEKARGYTFEETAQIPLKKQITAASFQSAKKILSTELPKALADPTYAPPRLELEFYRKDGSTLWIESAFSLIRDKNGKPLSILAIGRNIDKRKQIESQREAALEALRESEEKYRWVMDNMADVITIMDMDLRFTYVSTSVQRMRGYTAEEVKMQKLEQTMTPESLQISLQAFEEEIKLEAGGKADPGRIRILEIEQYRKDGSTIWMEVGVSFMRDKSQKPVGIIVVSRDITERKEAQEEKIRLEAQLQQSQKMESVGRLAGGIAHDFNNMLGVILGYSELAIKKAGTDNPLQRHLAQILDAAQRSASLTRQLLAFARRQTIAPIVLDLNNTIESMLKMLKRLIGEHIELKWHPKADLWPVKIDPSQIDQILANLCVNARDAITDVGKVLIETDNTTLDINYCTHHTGFVPGDYLRLTVSDNGQGMSKETQAKLFEPFFTTKKVGKGTGLGLATVYGIVQQNNGFIQVYSEPGQGTSFVIYLHRHTDIEGEAQQAEIHPAAAGGRETILLVEDEPAILEMATTMLEYQGYTVLATVTPGDAISLAKEHKGEIDLMLSDVVMPEMNGRDLAINLMSINPDLKIIFMSGYTANDIGQHGVLDEGVYFIQKPFSIEQLSAKIREALDSNKNQLSE